jgi:heme oxygenase
VHAALDPAIQAASSDDRVAHIFDESHLRLRRIDQDLEDLSSTELAAPLPATESFVGYINEASKENPVSLIGVLYVKEGATNGNKFIAKKLRATMGLAPDQAMGYLDPHGADQRRCWNAFKVALNELDLTEQEQEDCVAAAQETFRMVINISNQIPVEKEVAAT